MIRAEPDADSMQQPLTENLLAEDHARLGDLINQLCVALEEYNVEQSFALLDLVWARLAVHIRAEHLCLFPAILDAAKHLSAQEGNAPQFDQVQGSIYQLRRDHDFFMHELARIVNAVRDIKSSANAGLLREQLQNAKQTVIAIKARLEKHNKLEEEQVYRWPTALLDAAEQAQLAERVRCEIENMPPRFA